MIMAGVAQGQSFNPGGGAGSRRRAGRPAVASLLLAGTFLAAPAFAQLPEAPPMFRNSDENNIDLLTGLHTRVEEILSIGDGPAALRFRITVKDHGLFTNFDGMSTVTQDENNAWNAESWFEADRNNFSGAGPSWTSLEGDAATLFQSGSNVTWTRPDGTTILFRHDLASWHAGAYGYPTEITYPGGHKIKITYKVITSTAIVRIQSVNSSQGYQLKFSYTSATSGILSSVQAINNAVDYCDPAADSCTGLTQSWPTVQLTQSIVPGGSQPAVFTVTNTKNETSTYTYNMVGYLDLRLAGIRRPGASSDNLAFSYNWPTSRTVTNDGVTHTYTHGGNISAPTLTKVSPSNVSHVVVSDPMQSRPVSVSDQTGRTTGFTYDGYMRLTRKTEPEGNYTQFTYDSRGNVTQTRRVAKSGSGLADIVTSATYSSSCTNLLICNQPTSTTDARSAVTDYTYDSGTGFLTAMTAPAVGGVRPETRYTYSSRQAYYKNGAGSIVASGMAVSLPTAVSACQTGSSCSGAADEVKTVIDYGPQSSGTANNLHVASTTTGSGNGALAATAAYGYDSVGNPVTVDGPLSGTADTSRTRYDSERRIVGIVGPDPDGTGALKHRAARTTWNAAGRVSKVERGTVDSQSDSDWAAMTVLDTIDYAYDANARKVKATFTSGGVVQEVAQYSYDSDGRPECTAQRMNASVYGSLPTSACSLGTEGSFGPDRIARTVYSGTNQVHQAKNAVGTSLEAADMTATYRDNGQVETFTDAEGNKTTYEYDGHDRLAKTRFPDTTKGAGTSSTTDYEQLTYDAGSNVTSRRLRDGNSIGHTFDALNRMTAKDLPGTEPDVGYTYDLLGRMTGASQTGNSLGFTYDALGRNLTQVGPHGTVTSTWDIGGRRTRITHPDSFYVDQDYLVTGEVEKIRQNGATSGIGLLATYGYDDLGRRTSLARGNGTSTSYGYDAASRLSSLGHDLAGTTHDLTLGFSYNPASQIVSSTRSNDLYAWGRHYNVNRNYTANGRNQYTASGAITPTYDTKGNLTSAGSVTYGYSSENMLTTATGGVTLLYDPAMRLYQVAAASTTRFAYDGTNMIGEYNGSNVLQQRYVFGPGQDELLVWYYGAVTTDPIFYHNDERGSIVAGSWNTGGVAGVNSYDESGVPAAGNQGKFQYTGQIWLSELGLYHYKARFYSPTLGRFLQTDPIGYAAGPNLYNYVGSDPVNKVDPMGLREGDIPITCKIIIDGSCSSKDLTEVLWDSTLGRVMNEKGEGDVEEPPAKPLSRCMQSFLKRHKPGTDWSRIRIVMGRPMPGMAGTVYGDNGAYNITVRRDMYHGVEQNLVFLFHELAHPGQYHSGQLTWGKYMAWILPGVVDKLMSGDGKSVHGRIPVERDANAFAREMMNHYDNDKRPCDR